MPRAYPRVEAGTTVQFTWTGSTNPSSLSLRIRDATGTIVYSAAAISSGGTGGWYTFVTLVDSFARYPQTLVAEWTAIASTFVSNSTPFISRMGFDVIKTKPYGQPGGLSG